MVDTKSVDQQLLRFDHVIVAIARKFAPQFVAGLARSATAETVGYDQRILGAVERLPAPEQLRTEGVDNGFATTIGAVQQQHRIREAPFGIAPRCSKCDIVLAKLRQRLAGLEAKVAEDEICFFSARRYRS